MAADNVTDTSTAMFTAETSLYDRGGLPQYGFGVEFAFDKLVESNPFLFRVHTPKAHSSFYDNAEPYFVGQAFQDGVGAAALAPEAITPYRAPSQLTYAHAARHMDFATRADSPFVSASFSFAWAIWEATRRYHHGMKHDVEIAVLDARALSGKAVTAVELLHQAKPKERHQDHWKWWRYAHEAQDVLVWGYVPGTAILASIPLTHLLPKLPSYLLLPSPPPTVKETPLSRLAWPYTQKHYSYRTFCTDMSARFLAMPSERTMCDATAGAARLALAFLRPWFLRIAADDPASAAGTAQALAQSIAYWPGAWWAREHTECAGLIRGIVWVVAEEARAARRVEAMRVENVMGGLERLSREFNTHGHGRRGSMRSSFTLTSETETASLDGYGEGEDGDETKVGGEIEEVVLKLGQQAETEKVLHVCPPVFSPSPLSAPSGSKLVPPPPSLLPAHMLSPLPSISPEMGAAKGKERAHPHVHAHVDRATSPISPSSLANAARRLFDTARVVQDELFGAEWYARTASTFLTGFFIGTFLTLCVLSPQRREIANHFT